MSDITDMIEEVVNTPIPPKCGTCVALLAIDEADRKALDQAYAARRLNAKQVAEILTKAGVYHGSLRHSPQIHYREGHLK